MWSASCVIKDRAHWGKLSRIIVQSEVLWLERLTDTTPVFPQYAALWTFILTKQTVSVILDKSETKHDWACCDRNIVNDAVVWCSHMWSYYTVIINIDLGFCLGAEHLSQPRYRKWFNIFWPISQEFNSVMVLINILFAVTFLQGTRCTHIQFLSFKYLQGMRYQWNICPYLQIDPWDEILPLILWVCGLFVSFALRQAPCVCSTWCPGSLDPATLVC